MALSVGIDVARSSLATASEQLSVVSRNIARVGEQDATRKTTSVVTGPGTQVHIGRVGRTSSSALLTAYLDANAASQSQSAIVSALDTLETTVNDTDLERSPAALISKLSSALQSYSSAPDNPALAGSVVSAAKTLVNTLNEGSETIANVRRQADTDIADSVDRINNLLAQFSDLNKQVVVGTKSGADITDTLDARDSVLKQLSSEIGIQTVERSDGDLAIYTDSGVTLFEKVPRTVTFSPSPLLSNGQSGSAIYADGVPIAGTPNMMAISTGRLAGLVQIRDVIAPTYERQLDEIARGLIEAFAETDQSATPTLADAAGLFTYPGGPAIPTSGTSVSGLAALIQVNANVDPTQGGNALLLRDGGISGNSAYKYNSTGAASYSDRILGLVASIDQSRSFDGSSELPQSTSLTTFAKSSVSWLEALRQSAKSDGDYRKAVSERASSALSKETGINLDEEMTHMLELERTFQASSRLISTIDQMLSNLLETLG